MTDYCFKIHDLSDAGMHRLKDRMAGYVRHGVRMTFLRRVAYIHMNDAQRFCGLFNALCYYNDKDMLTASEKSLAWAKKWHPLW